MYRSVPDEKYLRFWDCFSPHNWIVVPPTLSLLLKLSQRKLGRDLFSKVSSSVELNLNKSTILPHLALHGILLTCLGCYSLFFLGFLQKQVRRNAGPILHASFKSLAHCRNIASLSLFDKHFVETHLNLLNWFWFLILVGVPLVIIIFLSP